MPPRSKKTSQPPAPPVAAGIPQGPWPRVSDRTRELMRRGAEMALNSSPHWAEALNAAMFTGSATAFDPVIVEGSKRSSRVSIVRWSSANVEQPGERVPGFITTDMINNARELVWRGQEEAMLNAMRAAQAAAWQQWMQIAFQLTTDAQELQDLLSLSAHSINSFNSECTQLISRVIKEALQERDLGTHVERRQIVTQLLEGHSLQLRNTSQRLDYALDQPHRAAIIWSEEAHAHLHELEQAAAALRQCTGGGNQHLVVMANAATLWVWVPATGAFPVDEMTHALRALPKVRMAVATANSGIDGFRRSHLDAVAAQQQLSRLRSDRQIIQYEDVQLISLLSRDMEALQRFIARTLGPLAEPRNGHAALRKSLQVFLASGCNITQAATQLHTHRNTLLRRLDKAIQLLPQPLENQRLQVATALEALSWTQSQTQGAD